MRLRFHTIPDLLHFEFDILAVARSDPLQALPRLLMPAFLSEPPDALLQSQHPNAQAPGEQQLQPDGDLPLPGLPIADVLGHAEVDPVRREDAQREHQLVEAAHLPADLLGHHLGGEHGHDDAAAAQADAREDAAEVERLDGVRVDRLDQRAQHEDERADGNRPLAAQLVGDGPDGEAGEEGAQLLQPHGEGGDARGFVVAIAEVALVRGQREHAADDPGIVSDCEARQRAVKLPQHAPLLHRKPPMQTTMPSQ